MLNFLKNDNYFETEIVEFKINLNLQYSIGASKTKTIPT